MSEFGIVVMNADGSAQKSIGGGINPTWSPDGTKIAYESVDAISTNIFVMNGDGSNASPVTTDDFFQFNNHPDWSPDGAKIAFEYLDCSAFFSWAPLALQTVDPDGGNRQPLGGGLPGYNPAWSPDGAKIVFNQFNANANDNSAIRVANRDGSGAADLTAYSSRNTDPAWGPVLVPSSIDDPQVFVTQHYRDSLNREPDPSGLAFWTNEIIECGSGASCIEAKRINVSAAFFLSIEFQETGYLVYRMYKSSYGNLAGAPVPIKLNEFCPIRRKLAKT